MQQGTFRGFEVALQGRGIAVITMNQPERLNGMTQGMKRDMIEILTEAQMDDGRPCCGDHRLRPRLLSRATTSPASRVMRTGATAIMPDINAGHDSAHRHVRRPARAVADAEPGRAQPRQAQHRGHQRRRHPDRPVARAVVRLPDRIDGGAAGQRARFASDLCRTKAATACSCRFIGVAKTMDFLMRNRIVSGQEACELGLVHEAAPPDQLMERTLALATEMADGPQVAMRLLKRSVYNAAEQTLAHALDDIAAKTALSDHHPDAREGIRAFQEKRPAKFS